MKKSFKGFLGFARNDKGGAGGKICLAEFTPNKIEELGMIKEKRYEKVD